MSKRANPMAVKAALTYDMVEAARALNKSPATIRNWIRNGLPVMTSSKPHLISGADLRDYLRAKYRSAKTPLERDELYCLSCRCGRTPLDLTVDVFANTPKTLRLQGQCGMCGATSSRMISKAKLEDFTQTFHIKNNAGSEAYMTPLPTVQISKTQGGSNHA